MKKLFCFSDEAYKNSSVVSLGFVSSRNIEDLKTFHECIKDLCSKSRISEFKWSNGSGDKYLKAIRDLLSLSVEFIRNKNVNILSIAGARILLKKKEYKNMSAEEFPAFLYYQAIKYIATTQECEEASIELVHDENSGFC